jgi:hypothetical protein
MSKILIILFAGIFLSFQTKEIIKLSPYQNMPKEVSEGKVIMEQRCVKCHVLKKVNDYSVERWEKVLPKMAKKAKITHWEQEKITTFVKWKLSNR